MRARGAKPRASTRGYLASRGFVKGFPNPSAGVFSIGFEEQPMAEQRAFGQRNPQPQPQARVVRAEPKAVTPVRDAPIQTPVRPPSPPPVKTDFPPRDEDKEDWEEERKHGFKLPWRQLSLMASLCFGIASFVLPEEVNDNVQWLLYGLIAASLYAGFSKPRRQAKS